MKFNKWQQWLVTACGVVLVGAPYTPVSHFLEEYSMELLPWHPFVASALMLAHAGASVVIIRFLLLRVLHARRFNKEHKKA